MAFLLPRKINNPLPWILGLITGGILLVGTTTYLIVKTPSASEKIEELTVPVERENLAVEIKASGTVEPIQSVNISPKNPGRLVKLLVEQGDRVKQGQTLAVMENDEIQAQGMGATANFKGAIANLEEAQLNTQAEIKQAEARLFQAQAALEQARQRIPKQIEQARAKLRSAEAQLQLAQERIGRNEYLLKRGAISQDEFDEVLTEYRNAQANITDLAQRLEELKTTETPEIAQLEADVAEAKIALEQKKRTQDDQIAALAAAVEEAGANLKEKEIQFRDTIITAPFDGVVTQKYATVGAFVTPTTSASTTASATSSSILALAQGLEVVAKVPEVDIGQIEVGQPVNIFADAYPDRVFRGVVKRIAPEAVVEDNVTSFEVRVALVSGQDKLRSKMNADLTFLGKELSNTLVVPTVAIITQEGETGVMIVNEENKPEFVPVKIGLTLDDKTEVLEGLSPGQRVFIDLPEEERKKEDS